eukprot:495089-Rhodomonas_salina.1
MPSHSYEMSGTDLGDAATRMGSWTYRSRPRAWPTSLSGETSYRSDLTFHRAKSDTLLQTTPSPNHLRGIAGCRSDHETQTCGLAKCIVLAMARVGRARSDEAMSGPDRA